MKKLFGFLAIVAIAVTMISKRMNEKTAAKTKDRAEVVMKDLYDGVRSSAAVKDLRTNLSKMRGRVEKSIEKGRKRMAA